MATQIVQAPLLPQLPVGQEVIFAVSNNTIVATQLNVKFVADVYISTNTTLISTSATPTATFKTTPNNAGVGIFDFSRVVENYVSADNMAFVGSSYKGTETTNNTPHPLHLIDKYSRNSNTLRYLTIEFKTQYTDTNGDIVLDNTPIVTTDFELLNGYLKYTDELTIDGNEFGFSLGIFNLSDSNGRFLTNAPTTQYANLEDYGTLAFLAPNNNVSFIRLKYFNSGGVQLGTEDIYKLVQNGATNPNQGTYSSSRLLYFGCFPGNLQNWSSTFQALVTGGTIQGGSIEVQAFAESFPTSLAQSKKYTIKVNCPDTKGFESIRLCWLNQWGVWDYYTFNKKSVRSITTKGSTYQQQAGTWNRAAYRIDSYKGGKKTFRVNATEKITMNTDFVSESENVMFEELTNSPEVYILKGYQDDIPSSALNQYVIPVRLTTSSFTKKTIANDKLIQYSFEVEKSKTLRTQSV